MFFYNEFFMTKKIKFLYMFLAVSAASPFRAYSAEMTSAEALVVLNGINLNGEELINSAQMVSMVYEKGQLTSETQIARAMLGVMGFGNDFYQSRFPCKNITPFTTDEQANFAKAVALACGCYMMDHEDNHDITPLKAYIRKGFHFALGGEQLANNPNAPVLKQAMQIVDAVLNFDPQQHTKADDVQAAVDQSMGAHHASAQQTPSASSIEIEEAPAQHEIVTAVSAVDTSSENDPIYMMAVNDINKGLAPNEGRDGKGKQMQSVPFRKIVMRTLMNEALQTDILNYLTTVQNYSLPSKAPTDPDHKHGVYDTENSRKGLPYRVYFFEKASTNAPIELKPNKVRMARALDHLVVKGYISQAMKMAYLAAVE